MLRDKIDFEKVFDQISVQIIILKADAPNFTIIANNLQHKILTNTTDQDIKGKSLWEVFNLNNESDENGFARLVEAFLACIEKKEIIKLPSIKYNVLQEDGLAFKPAWWNVEVAPLIKENEVEYLICTSYNNID